MWPWLTIMALLFAADSAPARCLPMVSPAEELSRSTAVFSGTVVGREWVREPFVPPMGMPLAMEEAQFLPGEERTIEREWVVISVHRVWKGDVGAAHRMYTSVARYPRGLRAGLADHEFELKDGESYLIYANGPPDALRTSICQRTRLLGDAAEDLRALGESHPPAGS